MTGPEKTSLIYIKYTYSYYGIYPFSMCAIQTVNFIEFLRNFYIYDKIFVLKYYVRKKSYSILKTEN